MNLTIRLAGAMVLVASTFALTLSALANEHEHTYYPFATEEFHEVWERTDYPVQQLEVSRTWIWGPGANHPDLIEEEYAEADDDTRLVQYTDKSRMEWPWGEDADPESPWFITQGLLATELMTGRLQIGDDSFEQHLPADRPAAGDPDDVTGPTYLAMGLHIDRDARAEGEVITEVIDRAGHISEDASFAAYDVTDAYHIEQTDKNIASVFWEFMTSEGIVYVDGEYEEDELFRNAFYAIGYPKTDAFWASVKVDGNVQDLLVQCFERRCLTYTPGNPDGWEVESGNIGQHYYDWRYSLIDREAPIAPNDGSFHADGQQAIALDVGESALLTAQVFHGDFAFPHVEVHFEVTEGSDFVTLGAESGTTDSTGSTHVDVTADAEGVASVIAYVDLDGSGTFTESDDLLLGTVEVTVVDDEEVVIPDGGSFTFEGDLTADVEIGSTIDLTALVTASDEPFAGATVYFQVVDGVDVASIDVASDITNNDGIATVTVTGLIAGDATINAFVDLDGTGIYNAETDIDLGDVVVTVLVANENGEENGGNGEED